MMQFVHSTRHPNSSMRHYEHVSAGLQPESQKMHQRVTGFFGSGADLDSNSMVVAHHQSSQV